MTWQDDAACKGLTALFFPELGENSHEAKRVCATCPVRVACDDFALNNDEKHGIWGGRSERQRRVERRLRGIAATRREWDLEVAS